MNFLYKHDMTAAQLYRIADDAYANGSPWQLKTFQQDLANEYSHYVGIVDHNQLVGFAGGIYLDDTLDVSNVAILKTQQGKHLGEILLRTWFDEFSDGTKVLLEVRASNQAAQHLYQRLGFKTYRKRKAYYSRPVEDADLMMLELPIQVKE
ncbi:ribosomal protein S18-alanine N-acetyltransferase [Weissella paramesenteroides]